MHCRGRQLPARTDAGEPAKNTAQGSYIVMRSVTFIPAVLAALSTTLPAAPAAAQSSAKAVWTTTGIITSASGRGYDKATLDAIRKTQMSNRSCLLKTLPSSQLQAAIAKELGTCTYSTFRRASGAIRIVGNCTGKAGIVSVDFAGRYNANSYTGSNTSVFKTSNGDLKVTSNLSGTITGRC